VMHGKTTGPVPPEMEEASQTLPARKVIPVLDVPQLCHGASISKGLPAIPSNVWSCVGTKHTLVSVCPNPKREPACSGGGEPCVSIQSSRDNSVWQAHWTALRFLI
jgi:hypothetical protein